MHIARIISHLGAWGVMNERHRALFGEVESLLEGISDEGIEKDAGGRIALRRLNDVFIRAFSQAGWPVNVPLNRAAGDRRFRLDFAREGVGMDFVLGNQQRFISHLFISFPMFIRFNQIEIAVFLTLMNDLSQKTAPGAATFEGIASLFNEIAPVPVKYPFLVLGLSRERQERQVRELTTDIDNYLIGRTGLSLSEAILMEEQPGYDFKEILPSNHKLAAELCAFANSPGGGLLLVGITDEGEVRGIEQGELDRSKLKITSIARDVLNPIPEVGFAHFPLPERPGRVLLCVEVGELKLKPCLFSGRAYLRVGASARIASPEEIRDMIVK